MSMSTSVSMQYSRVITHPTQKRVHKAASQTACDPQIGPFMTYCM